MGGGCECGPCVRAAAAAAGAAPAFVCLPSPALVPGKTTRIRVCLDFLIHGSVDYIPRLRLLRRAMPVFFFLLPKHVSC